jgi:peptide/nickel transport system substrate-binding protein
MRKTILALLVCIALLLIIIPGCGKTTPTTSTPPKTTTTTPVTTTSTPPKTTATTTVAPDYPPPLNPNAQTGGTMIINHNAVVSFISAPADGAGLSQRIGRNVFEPLLVCDANLVLKPWLATSVTTSADGKAITLKLRQGVQFTDGTPFNADAVKFNLQLDLQNNITGSAVLKNIVSYDIPDQYTITLNLATPDATLLLGLAQTNIGLMASPTAQQKPTTPDTITQIHCVGTGPFMYDSWQRDSYVQFKANPNYWQKGKPYLSALRFNFVPDQTASLLAFRSGQANMVMTIDPIDAVKLTSEGFFVGNPTFLKYLHSIIPDGANPDSPFSKVEVRQALEYALNKAELTAVGNGYFDAATEFAKPSDLYFDSTITPRNFDLAKCKQLLTAAGYPNGVDVIVITNQSIRADTENLILAQLKAAGFNVTKVDAQTSAAYTTTTQKGWRSTTAGVGSILMPGYPTPDNLTSFLGLFNANLYPDMYNPPSWKDAWTAIQTQTNDALRNAQIKTLVRQAFDTALILPYQYDSSRYVTDSKVQGWKEWYLSTDSADFYLPSELWLKTK